MAGEWALLSTHGLVLIALGRHGPGLTLRQIGDSVGIAERSAFRIITDLEAEGFVRSHKIGRRNFYELCPDAPLRHPLMGDLTLRDLIGGILRHGVRDAAPPLVFSSGRRRTGRPPNRD